MPKAQKQSAAKANGTSKGKSKASYISSAGPGPKLYSSFLPIPLVLPISPLPHASSSSASSSTPTQATHYIYVRPHVSKAPKLVSSTQGLEDTEDVDDGAGRTAFVANLPVDIAERDLLVIFGRWGVVESVTFTGFPDGNLLEQAVLGLEPSDDDESEDELDAEMAAESAQAEDRAEPTFVGNGPKLPRRLRSRRKPTLPASVPDVIALPPLDPRSTPYAPSGTRCAHVTFLDSLPLTRLMAHSGALDLASYGTDAKGKSVEPTGLAYYMKQYDSLRPSLSAIKEFADSSMARFDHLHSLLLQSRAKKSGAGALVDEDGFTVVVRGGRYGRTGGRGPGSSGVGVAKKGFGKSRAGEEEMAAKNGKRKGSGARPLDDFYRFQKTERKRQGESSFEDTVRRRKN